MTSAELAATVVDALVRGGVTEAVLSPGSRSAPLAYALHRADGDGRLRLHVRVDERTAGFLALGLATGSGRPVAVLCTSGTAAANLHPAVLEAAHRGVPLVVLTADRPGEMVGTGANQTTDQHGIYGSAVRWSAHLDSLVPAAAPTVTRSLTWALGTFTADPGPVHLNVALREPLVASPAAPVGPSGPSLPSPSVPAVPPSETSGPADAERTLVLAGDGATRHREQLTTLAAHWPVIAEPSAGLGGVALDRGVWLLGSERWLVEHRPERVVVVGAPTLHRAVQRLLADDAVEVVVVAEGPRWPDAARRARHVVGPVWLARSAAAQPAGSEWWAAWRDAAGVVAAVVDADLDGSWPSGPAVARAMLATLPAGAVLQVGSSNPVRDVDVAARARADVTVVANRGLAGIDGTVSSALGLALARPDAPAYALMGDLTFLHDLNGLLIGPGEPRPDSTLVVINDDGGGIFATLEQGGLGADGAEVFERLFGTPTGADLAALCAGFGVPHRRISERDDLTGAVAEAPHGIRVLEVAIPRDDRRRAQQRLTRAVDTALMPGNNAASRRVAGSRP
ncbi:MAG: 2-succinyl-5-enolpyruvyl-6-hydroxy-3-cyclohexene-1-carboxylic-acid synthase [bacterium]